MYAFITFSAGMIFGFAMAAFLFVGMREETKEEEEDQ